MSLRSRIAWIVSATVAVVVLLAGFGVQTLAQATLLRTIDHDLGELARLIDSDPRGVLYLTGPGRGRLGGAAGVVQIIDRNGVIQPLRGPRAGQQPDVTLPVDSSVRDALRRNDTLLTTVSVENVRLRMLVQPVTRQFAVQVARPIDEIDEIAAALRDRTLFVSGVTALVAASLAWFIAGHSIRPVTALTRAVEQVNGPSDVARGIQLGATHGQRDDEVARLARAFDAMLIRIDAARQAQERLAADAAHELKTPLTSLRTNIEVLSDNADQLDNNQYQQLTTDVLGQLDELNMMVDGLVALARVDAATTEKVLLDVTSIAADVVAQARRRFPERANDMSFNGADEAIAYANLRDVSLALSSLIDNAVKYAPNGLILVTVATEDTPKPVIRLGVADAGPGVDGTSLPHLFDRFYRSPDAHGVPGAGLGLALVQRVAHAHDGHATARNLPDGFEVSLTLRRFVPAATG